MHLNGVDPDKAWEYRQAGLLYWRLHRHDEWKRCNVDESNRSNLDWCVELWLYQYAVLVEED